MTNKFVQKYTIGEEIANSITHGIGVALSITGLVMLIIFSASKGTVWHIVSNSIYGASLIALYLSSTLYHSIPKISVKKILKVIDHSAIFILIAGTYTPFLLTNLRGPWGWSLFGVIWGLALAGIIIKAFFIYKLKKLSIAIYISMGWLVMIAMKQIILHVPKISVIFLIVGGLFYTLGVIFYAWKKLPYGHAVWHLFVMGGSIFHYFAVYKCL